MNRVRPAMLVDAPAIARIDVETWRSSYAGLLPDKYLVELSEAARRRQWGAEIAHHPGTVLVATDAIGRVRGFGSCGTARGPIAGLAGEIFTLYIAGDHQGCGMGRELLLGLFARLRARKLESALVWVLRDNPSRFFYERLGGKLVGRRRVPFAGQTVETVAYGWPDLAAALKAQARTGGSFPEG